jgi:hypothetical protein
VADGTEETFDATKKKSKELCSVSNVGDVGGAGKGSLALLGLCAGGLVIQRVLRRRRSRER